MRARERRKRGQEREQERGQAAVFIALCLFTMVVFMAMATNMGTLVNDRIRMQNTADLTAYAGAFEQARALNRLTAINKRIFITAQNVRAALTCPGFPEGDIDAMLDGDEPFDCATYDQIFGSDLRIFPHLKCEDQTLGHLVVQNGQIKMNALAAAFMIENFRANETSIRSARFTAGKNFQGTERPSKSSFYEHNLLAPTFRANPLIQVERVTTRFGWATFEFPGQCDCPSPNIPFEFPPFDMCVDTYEDEVDSWFVKANYGPTVYFPARVNGVPQKDFLDIKNEQGGYFGADAADDPRGSDELWAFAVAKPFGGNVGHENGDGRVKTLEWDLSFPLLEGYGSLSNSADWNSFEEDDILLGFSENYRARMAGLQDRMLSDPNPNSGVPPQEVRPLTLMMQDMAQAAGVGPVAIRRYTTH